MLVYNARRACDRHGRASTLPSASCFRIAGFLSYTVHDELQEGYHTNSCQHQAQEYMHSFLLCTQLLWLYFPASSDRRGRGGTGAEACDHEQWNKHSALTHKLHPPVH